MNWCMLLGANGQHNARPTLRILDMQKAQNRPLFYILFDIAINILAFLIYGPLSKKGAFRFLICCVLTDLALSISSTLKIPGNCGNLDIKVMTNQLMCDTPIGAVTSESPVGPVLVGQLGLLWYWQAVGRGGHFYTSSQTCPQAT